MRKPATIFAVSAALALLSLPARAQFPYDFSNATCSLSHSNPCGNGHNITITLPSGPGTPASVTVDVDWEPAPNPTPAPTTCKSASIKTCPLPNGGSCKGGGMGEHQGAITQKNGVLTLTFGWTDGNCNTNTYSGTLTWVPHQCPNGGCSGGYWNVQGGVSISCNGTVIVTPAKATMSGQGPGISNCQMVPQQCPAYMHLNNANGECQRTSCPVGQTPNPGGTCSPITCPQGQALNAVGECVVVCPVGYAANANGQCLPVSCPQGWVADSTGTCFPAHCPSGEVPTVNGCKPVKPLAPICPPGTLLVNGVCINQSQPPASRSPGTPPP